MEKNHKIVKEIKMRGAQTEEGVAEMKRLKKVVEKYYKEQLLANKRLAKSKINDPKWLEKVELSLVKNYGNKIAACSEIGVSYATLRSMMCRNPEFGKFVNDICDMCEELKSEFYEMRLIEKIDSGDSQCIIFANKTFNKQKGYSEKQEINMKGDIEVTWGGDAKE